VEKKWSSCRFLEEFSSKGWSRTSLDRLTTNIYNGLPTDRIICRRSVKTTAIVVHIEELILSHGVASHSSELNFTKNYMLLYLFFFCVLRFIKIKLASCHLLLYVVYTYQKSFNVTDGFNCYMQKM